MKWRDLGTAKIPKYVVGTSGYSAIVQGIIISHSLQAITRQILEIYYSYCIIVSVSVLDYYYKEK